jgi:hypothetical protein
MDERPKVGEITQSKAGIEYIIEEDYRFMYKFCPYGFYFLCGKYVHIAPINLLMCPVFCLHLLLHFMAYGHHIMYFPTSYELIYSLFIIHNHPFSDGEHLRPLLSVACNIPAESTEKRIIACGI